jgi:MFS family permease
VPTIEILLGRASLGRPADSPLYSRAMPTRDVRDGDGANPIASTVVAATIAASALVAQHVIGKATRDALFLSSFSAARFPLAMTASTVLSGGIVILFGRLIARFGPARVVPRLFALHALVFVVDWGLAQRFERVAAVAVYLHTASLGATILSAFWSVVSEAFDPHTGKRSIGRIAGGAALGGALGGGLAWGGSRLLPVPAMLLAGAALSLLSMWGVNLLARQTHESHAETTAGTPRPSGFEVLRDTPYLRFLGALVVVGALCQSLLDYALAVQAKATYGGGARLLGFLAAEQDLHRRDLGPIRLVGRRRSYHGAHRAMAARLAPGRDDCATTSRGRVWVV